MQKTLKEKITLIENKKREDFKKMVQSKVDSPDIADEVVKDKSRLFDFDKNVFKRAEKSVDDLFSVISFPINEKNFGVSEHFANKHFPTEEVKVIIKNRKFKDLEEYLKRERDFSIFRKYINIMDARRHSVLEELYLKMDEIGRNTKNLRAFGNLFGRFWDLSVHDLYSLPIEQIKRFSELLKQKDFLNRIADLLGRLATSSREYEEYLIKEIKFAPNSKQFYSSPTNTVGVTTGADLEKLLSYQFALRKLKNAKAIFNKNFIEKKLLQFDRKDQILDEVETFRKEKRFKEDSKGPFVIVVDTSGSMHGEPETIAKAFALALIKIANKEDRKCFIISFSTSTIEFDATNIASDWTRLFQFLSYSFSGGTDIGPAISGAIRKVKERDYQNADVILVSDLIINSLGADLEKEVNKLKNKKVRFHSLTIGNSYHELNSSFLDNNWIYDGSEQSIDNIVKSLEEMNKPKKDENKT